MPILRSRQRFGQYRVEGRISTGGFAEVYRAYDTVEGVRVALKLPRQGLMDKEAHDAFRREARVVGQLDHPNILPIKTAGTIDGHFVIVTPLGIESLGERLARRMARKTALSLGTQLVDGLAFAHRRKIAHLDIKPHNLILFPENRLKLADFGLARVVARTLSASGSGTIGYLAPEQALGRPSLASDVFSAGLLLWRLMGGTVPGWPFEWPYPDLARVEKGWDPRLVRLVRRATDVDARKRPPTAVALQSALARIGEGALL